MAVLMNRTIESQVLKISRFSAFLPRHFDTFSSAKHHAVKAAVAEEKQSLKYAKPFSEIPGPKRFPLVGSLFTMMTDKDFDTTQIDKYWKKLVRDYGPLVRLDIPGLAGSLIVVSDPDDSEKLARATMDNPLRQVLFSLAKVRRERADNFFEKKCGILIENGEEWKRVRSRAQTPMMKPQNIATYLTQMDEVALNFMERIATFQRELGEMPSDFLNEIYKWALESVSLVALNRRMGCLEPNLASDSEPMMLIKETNNMLAALNENELGVPLWRLYPTASYRKLQKSHDTFLRIVDAEVEQTEAHLLANEKHSEDKLTLMETLLLTPGLTRKDVITLMIDVISGGIDTTSNTIAFTLYLLAKNHKSQTKLQEEIDRVVGDHKGPLDPKHLAQLSYMKAVLKESQRVFPISIGSMRTLGNDIVLSGYLVPEGASVVVFGLAMGHDERYFPRAKEFLPERWLRDRPLGPIHPFSSLPFGLGARMCIGRRIAEQEMYTLLTRIMQRYTIDYKYKDMGTFTRTFIVPSEPLRFSFTERK